MVMGRWIYLITAALNAEIGQMNELIRNTPSWGEREIRIVNKAWPTDSKSSRPNHSR